MTERKARAKEERLGQKKIPLRGMTERKAKAKEEADSPEGNDRQKGKGKSNGNGNGKARFP